MLYLDGGTNYFLVMHNRYIFKNYLLSPFLIEYVDYLKTGINYLTRIGMKNY